MIYSSRENEQECKMPFDVCLNPFRPSELKPIIPSLHYSTIPLSCGMTMIGNR